MKKPSEWLGEIGSHAIVDSEAAKADFKKETGYDAPSWPAYSPEDTRKAIKHRGMGGSLSKKPAKQLAYGWLMAEAVADKLVPKSGQPWTIKYGRGSRFWAAVEVLQEAGL